MKRIKVQLSLDKESYQYVYTKRITLPDYPIIGDQIVVWANHGTSGLHVRVESRHWDSQTEYLGLMCSFPYELDEDKLKQHGWK